MRIPKKRRRIVDKRETTTKRRIIAIMCELEPGLTKTEAAKAYDRVTAAVNGWMLASARHLPKGIQFKLVLADACTINMCWLKGIPGVYADWPVVWIGLPAKARRWLQQQRAKEHNDWKRRGRDLPGAMNIESGPMT